MGKTPCCEKMGLKKGPWTKEEDHILINYINRHGHGNWRTLPKHAGLSRCGKSCRLRWTNYLRPGIKRGNFSKEEEDTIFKLHQTLGNRWSLIAATLPGRTDNEIKNVWNTHLKKRLQRCSPPATTKQQQQQQQQQDEDEDEDEDEDHTGSTNNTETLPEADGHKFDDNDHHHRHQHSNLPISSTISDLDQDFWAEHIDHSFIQDSYHSEGDSEPWLTFPLPQGSQQELDHDLGLNESSITQDSLDFWSDLFTLD